MAGLPGAQAGFGSLRPVINEVFKTMLAQKPVAVLPVERK